MKKVLILGIGNAQVDPLKYCKDKGYEVHACSYTPDGRGKRYCDHFSLIDITDFNAVLEYARDHHIDVVYSTGSDVAMPTASYVSDALGLPHFVSTEIAVMCNTKQKLREYIGQEPYNVRFQEIDAKDSEIHLDYPFIMKPVDSQGQRGIKLIESREEFIEHFDIALSYSRSKKTIIEEYINGPEISANVYVVDGEPVFSLVSDRISWPQFEGGIIHKHIIPSNVCNKESDALVTEMIHSVLHKLNIMNGPVYFQIKLHEGRPKLIEVTPRLDGCHMWRLINEATGVNLLDITMNHLIENTINHNNFKQNDISLQHTLEFICREPGSIVDGTEYALSEFVYLEKYYNAGESVKPMNGYMEKIGYFISSCEGLH